VTTLLQDPASRRTISVLLLVFGGVLTVARLGIELLWYIGSERELGESVGMDALFVVLSICITALLVILFSLSVAPNVGANISSERVTTWATVYAFSSLALLFVGGITPFSVVRGTPQDAWTVVVSHILSIGIVAMTCSIAAFLYFVLSAGRSRRDRTQHFVLAAHSVALWLCSVYASTSTLLLVIEGLLLVSGCFVAIASIQRQRWLVALPTSSKVRMIWATTSGAAMAFLVFVTLTFYGLSATTQSTALFIPGIVTLLASVSLFGSVVLLRLLAAVVASLPNSGVVHRRSNEIESIMQLNRLVMETRNHDQLYRTATRLAFDVCQAHGTWVELYGSSGMLSVKGEYLIRVDFIEALHAEYNFRALATAINTPIVIPSVDDHVGRRGALPGIGSIIVVPIIDEGQRYGSLIVFNTIEFGLDRDDLRLLTAFGDQIHMFLEQHRLQTANAASERLHQEFRVASTIQLSLLPQNPPANSGIDVYSVMMPAYEVGGDYYDYVTFSNGNTGIIIADVSGKGIPAALYMATLKGAVLSAMRDAEGPADLLRRLNASLFKNMRPGIYITMACIEFNPESASVRLARAGHMPTFVVRQGVVTAYRPAGLAIGLAASSLFDTTLEEMSIQMHHGDVCLLTTDGVVERRNIKMEELGFDAVVETLATSTLSSAHIVVRSILDQLVTHGLGTDAHDDITIVAIRCTSQYHNHNLSQTVTTASYSVSS